MYKLIENKDSIYKVTLKEKNLIKSKHTSKDLKEYKFESTFKERVDDSSYSMKFKKFLEKAKNRHFKIANGLDLETESYFVEDYNYSSRNSNVDNYTTNIYNFTLKVREVEEFNIEQLLIDNEEYEVLRYSEEISKNDSVIIDTILRLSEQEKKSIINLQIAEKVYFNVNSLGVRDYSLKMRFGKIYWSKHDDFYKADATLVEDKYDEEKDNVFNRMHLEQRILIKKLSEQIEYNKLLEDLLIEKKLLSEKEIKKINKKAKENYINNTWKFTLVKDVEK